jgi:hypothetical protein
MTGFYKEATRLWDLETGVSSLTRLQAGLCLCKSFHGCIIIQYALGICSTNELDWTTASCFVAS